MRITLIKYGHSVSVTGFRLGHSVLWDNKIVLSGLNKSDELSYLSHFWNGYFHKFFYKPRSKKLYKLWREHFGVLLESLVIWRSYSFFVFKFFLYFDFFNFLYRNLLFTQVRGMTRNKISGGRTSYKNRNFIRSKRFRNPRDTYLFRKSKIFQFDSRNWHHLNVLLQASSLVRERRHLNSMVVSSRRAAYLRKFFVRLDNRLGRFSKLVLKRFKDTYNLFLFYNAIRKSAFYRLYNSVNYKFMSSKSLQPIGYLLKRFERFFYFAKLFRGIFSFFKRLISRELLVALKASEFTVDIVISSSFVYPNIASQFVILKLRKWYRIGEIFSSLRYIFKRKRMLKGILVRAKGRLTKRQRATKHNFRKGSLPFSTKLKSLFFYHRVYPMKYGTSSISVCFFLQQKRSVTWHYRSYKWWKDKRRIYKRLKRKRDLLNKKASRIRDKKFNEKFNYLYNILKARAGLV